MLPAEQGRCMMKERPAWKIKALTASRIVFGHDESQRLRRNLSTSELQRPRPAGGETGRLNLPCWSSFLHSSFQLDHRSTRQFIKLGAVFTAR